MGGPTARRPPPMRRSGLSTTGPVSSSAGATGQTWLQALFCSRCRRCDPFLFLRSPAGGCSSCRCRAGRRLLFGGRTTYPVQCSACVCSQAQDTPPWRTVPDDWQTTSLAGRVGTHHSCAAPPLVWWGWCAGVTPGAGVTFTLWRDAIMGCFSWSMVQHHATRCQQAALSTPVLKVPQLIVVCLRCILFCCGEDESAVGPALLCELVWRGPGWAAAEWLLVCRQAAGRALHRGCCPLLAAASSVLDGADWADQSLWQWSGLCPFQPGRLGGLLVPDHSVVRHGPQHQLAHHCSCCGPALMGGRCPARCVGGAGLWHDQHLGWCLQVRGERSSCSTSSTSSS